MTTVRITAKWESTHTIDSEDFPDTDLTAVDWDNLSDWPDEVLEIVNTTTASLIDWDTSVSP